MIKEALLQSIGIIAFTLLTSNVFAQITETGTNVGISNTAPVHKLDVNGDVNLSTGRSIRFGSSVVLSERQGTDNFSIASGAGQNLNPFSRYNVLIGSSAGRLISSGRQNSFIGFRSGYSATVGYNNSFIGAYSGYNTTTGVANTFLGSVAGFENVSGNFNLYLGVNAGRNAVTGSNNIAIGNNAGQGNLASDNMFIGRNAFTNNTTGTLNAGLGYGSGLNNTTGNRNMFIGYEAGSSNISGSENTYIGYLADGTAALTNATAIGSGAQATADNMVQLGNSAVANVKTAGQLTTGALTYPNVDGTSGQVLTTDGAGAITWSTPTGSLLSGAASQTLRHNGTGWISSSLLYNDGTNIGIGTSTPSGRLGINGGTGQGLVVNTNGINSDFTATIENSGNGTGLAVSSNGFIPGYPSTPAAIYASGGTGSNGIFSFANNTGNYGLVAQGSDGADAIRGWVFSGSGYSGTFSGGSGVLVSDGLETDVLKLTDGASDSYILQSDASGNGSWVDPTSLNLDDGDWVVADSVTYTSDRIASGSADHGNSQIFGRNYYITTLGNPDLAAVRGKAESTTFAVPQSYTSTYCEGMLGVRNALAEYNTIPTWVSHIGVLGIKHDDGTNGIGVMAWNYDDNATNHGLHAVADGSGTDNLAIYAAARNGSSDNVAIGVPEDGGRVGIGDLSPSHKLHVNSAVGEDIVRFQVDGSTKLNISSDGGTNIGSGQQEYAPDGGLYINNELMVNTTTIATGYMVSVNGKIMCEELKVQNSGSWPDYVFAEEYDLPTLEEVEAHIDENKHLLGVPDACTVEEEGIMIGQMQKVMMEKIEELTLYMIDANRQIVELKKEVKGLKKSK